MLGKVGKTPSSGDGRYAQRAYAHVTGSGWDAKLAFHQSEVKCLTRSKVDATRSVSVLRPEPLRLILMLFSVILIY